MFFQFSLGWNRLSLSSFSSSVILYRKSTYFYGSYAGTCIPLHLQERFPIGWEYSGRSNTEWKFKINIWIDIRQTWSGHYLPALFFLSAAIFMGVNLSLLLVIAYLYFALFISIWRTQKLTPLGVFDYEFAVR